MCLTCGCMDAHLEMGQHNITYEDIKAAAEENGKTVAETFEIFDETLERDRTDHPDQTIRKGRSFARCLSLFT